MCKLYADINCGIRPIKNPKYNIYDYMTELTGIDKSTIESMMDHEIDLCIEQTKQKCLQAIQKRYHMNIITQDIRGYIKIDDDIIPQNIVNKKNPKPLNDEYIQKIKNDIQVLERKKSLCIDKNKKNMYIYAILENNLKIQDYLKRYEVSKMSVESDESDRIKDLGLIEFINKLVCDMCTTTQYKIFYLRFIDNKGQDEISEILGMSQSNVSKNEQKIIEIIKLTLGINDDMKEDEIDKLTINNTQI
jgi:RNA polymerase sigma factor (sigma-70 family)